MVQRLRCRTKTSISISYSEAKRVIHEFQIGEELFFGPQELGGTKSPVTRARSINNHNKVIIYFIPGVDLVCLVMSRGGYCPASYVVHYSNSTLSSIPNSVRFLAKSKNESRCGERTAPLNLVM